MKKKLHRTVFRYEVLSEEPITNCLTIEEIAMETREGQWSGRFLATEVQEELEGMAAADATRAQGSDPSFFSMDAEGNAFEDE